MPEVMGCGSFPVFDRGKYALRLERVRSVMEREGLDAVIATSEEDILYLTGVSFKTIERPFLPVVPHLGTAVRALSGWVSLLLLGWLLVA